MRDELFAGRRGGGARLNGAPMRASSGELARQLRNRGRLEHACGSRAVRRPSPTGRFHWRFAVADRFRRACACVCGGRPARRLRRAPYQCVGLSRWDRAGQRGWRLRERFLAQRWSHEGQSARCLCLWGQGCPYRRRGFRGRHDMTEITLNSRRRAGDDRASRRRGAKLACRRTGPPVARRPGNLERHQSDPLSGRRLDARWRGAGRRRPLSARSARLRAFRDFRGRNIGG